ncbi:MAG: hypothetical protein IKH37_10860 [Prevotella sp.]|nr:hypothetical protein [Prevotella sp.]
MRKEYIKPAIDMAAISSEQTLLVGTNGNNWAEGKEQTTVEDDDFFSEKEKDPLGELGFSSIWDDEKE